jgi:hypothetical protein
VNRPPYDYPEPAGEALGVRRSAVLNVAELLIGSPKVDVDTHWVA